MPEALIDQPPSVELDPETREGQIPLPAEGMGSLAYWQGELEAARTQIDTKIEQWRKNLNRYQNYEVFTTLTGDTVWVPKDYALTERKRSQLWFAMPALNCQPTPGQSPQTTQAAPVFAAVLNHYLGPDQFDADTAMTDVTFDAICPAGLLVSVLSYEATIDGEQPIDMGADPMTQQPLPPQMVPNVIHEQYAWKRLSPAFLVAPADWVGSRYDDAPFLGERFELDRALAMAKWNLTEDEVPEGRAPLKTLNEQEEKSSDRRQRSVVTGVRLEYKAALYDPEVKHPRRLRELVIFDGASQPVIHRDHPHQTVEPTGQLSGDSIQGYTIRVGSPRTISDGKFPPSDCQVSRPQVDELSKGRTQMVQQRNRNIPMRAADKGRLDATTIAKLQRAEYQEIILTDGDPNDILVEIAKSQFPRENFTFNQIITQDLEETWALSANQLAAQEAGQTATEASIRQKNTDARMAKEQQRVKQYAMGCVAVAATLIQRYADRVDYVEIVGTVGAQILAQSALLGGQPPPTPQQQQDAANPTTPTTVAYNKTLLQGSFLWTIKPDSQLRLDMTQERQFRLQTYNQFRRDPLINPTVLLTWALEPFGLGPQALAPPAQPSEKPYTLSITLSGDDFNPQMPQYSNAVALATLEGKPPQFETDPTPPVPVTPVVPHPGPMPVTNPLNKRIADQTGRIPGPGGEPNRGNV